MEPKLRPVSTPSPISIGNPHCAGVDTTEFDPNNDDGSLIQNCAQILRDGIQHGVEAVKSILGRWGTDLRWSAMLELEEVAVHELRQLEESVPEFHALLSEEVLPMEG